MTAGVADRVSVIVFVLIGLLGAMSSASAQDVAGVLEALRTQLGERPGALRLTGAGSGYEPSPDGGGRRYFRIERWSAEWHLERGTATDEIVRAVSAEDGASEAQRTETRTASAEAPWRERFLYWTAPHAFVAGADRHQARLETRTLRGTDYRVVVFTPPGGMPVRGFVDGDGRLERIRTDVEAPAGGRSTLEVVLFDWNDTPGSPVPDILLEKHDGELARVLVIDSVETAGGDGAAAAASGD